MDFDRLPVRHGSTDVGSTPNSDTFGVEYRPCLIVQLSYSQWPWLRRFGSRVTQPVAVLPSTSIYGAGPTKGHCRGATSFFSTQRTCILPNDRFAPSSGHTTDQRESILGVATQLCSNRRIFTCCFVQIRFDETGYDSYTLCGGA